VYYLWEPNKKHASTKKAKIKKQPIDLTTLNQAVSVYPESEINSSNLKKATQDTDSI
jgi:hypothetical protein